MANGRGMADAAFVQYLREEHGLYVAEVVGDGNCLFYALARALLNNTEQQMEIRRVVADFIRLNPEEFQGFADEYMTVDRMVRETLRNNNFSYEFQLIAASEAFGTNIVVYHPNRSTTSYPHDMRHPRTVRLSFHNEIHYNLLLDVDENLPELEPDRVIVLNVGQCWTMVSKDSYPADLDVNLVKDIPDKVEKQSLFGDNEESNENVNRKELLAILDELEDEKDCFLRAHSLSIIKTRAENMVQKLIFIWLQIQPFSPLIQLVAFWIFFCRLFVVLVCVQMNMYFYN